MFAMGWASSFKEAESRKDKLTADSSQLTAPPAIFSAASTARALTPAELDARLRTLKDLAAGKLLPVLPLAPELLVVGWSR